LNVVIYTRVSTAEQANDGYSIHEQKERLEMYARAQGWNVIYVYSDPAYSGGSLNRPSMQKLISDASTGAFSKVIVYKLDRLSRSQKDTLYLIEDVFLANNIDLVSMTENFDTGSPFGRAMIGILSVFAQLEREQIKERMNLGKDARAKGGYFHGGGRIPIGYDYIDGELIVNDYEAYQIRLIYDLAESGMPIYSVYKHMRDEGYQTKHGLWAESNVRDVLKNNLYTGMISWKGNIYKGRHKPIISAERYEAMQERLNLRKTQFPKHPFARTSLLGGLIFCGNCGARYFVKQNTAKHPGVTAQKYYTCYSRGKTCKRLIRDPNCKNKSFNTAVLDGIIINEVMKLAADPGALNSFVEDPYQDNTAAINKRMEEIETQIRKLIDLYQVDGIDFEVLNMKVSDLNRERKTLEDGKDQRPAPRVSIPAAKEILSTVPDILSRSDKEELKAAVHALIDGIIIRPDDGVEIHWAFA